MAKTKQEIKDSLDKAITNIQGMQEVYRIRKAGALVTEPQTQLPQTGATVKPTLSKT